MGCCSGPMNGGRSKAVFGISNLRFEICAVGGTTRLSPRRSSSSFAGIPSGNFLLIGCSAIPASWRRAEWMCSGAHADALVLIHREGLRVQAAPGTVFRRSPPMTRSTRMPAAEETSPTRSTSDPCRCPCCRSACGPSRSGSPRPASRGCPAPRPGEPGRRCPRGNAGISFIWFDSRCSRGCRTARSTGSPTRTRRP